MDHLLLSIQTASWPVLVGASDAQVRGVMELGWWSGVGTCACSGSLLSYAYKSALITLGWD